MEAVKTINGKKYCYLRIGTGSKKLLFLYGLSSFKEAVGSLVSINFPEYSVLVPDYPYHNHLLDAGVTLDSVASIAEYLSPLLREEGWVCFDAIGFSFGGLVLLDLVEQGNFTVCAAVTWASPIFGGLALSDFVDRVAGIYLKVPEYVLERVHGSVLVQRASENIAVKLIPPARFKQYLKIIRAFKFSFLQGSTRYLFLFDPADILVSHRNINYVENHAQEGKVAVVEVRGGGHFGTKAGWARALGVIKAFLAE